MNAIDDPMIPDDLSELLRTGARQQAVSPAPLHDVEHRARQRRRRRRGLACSGAAVAVVLVALAVVQLGGGDGSGETVTASAPPAPEGSVTQPVLVAREPTEAELPAGTDPDAPGGILDAVTSSGGTAWYVTEGRWYPTSGYVMADGRRFGIALSSPLKPDGPNHARLDQIGADGTVTSSRSIPLAAPAGSSASIRTIGATSDELIVERTIETLPVLSTDPQATGAGRIEHSTTFSAIDVDSGAERDLGAVEGNPSAGAAGDILVQAPGTDCTLEVSTLAGADRRTLDGGCNGTVPGLAGLASDVEVSPDGRYAAVHWMTIATNRPGAETLTVVDLTDGRVVHASNDASGMISGFAWTGEHDLTVAKEPEAKPIDDRTGGVTVRSIPWTTRRGG